MTGWSSPRVARTNSSEQLHYLLGFSGLRMVQDEKMLCFSLDSVLLADFARLTKDTRVIVDLGTGFAPVPLFLSTRASAAIYGMEIQPRAAEIARRNIRLNGLEDTITIVEDDLRRAHEHFTSSSADYITCNPPYYNYGTKALGASKAKNLAKHEQDLSLQDIVRTARYLLCNKGRLALVHKPERIEEVIALLAEERLHLKRLRMVHSRQDSRASRVLFEAVVGGRIGGVEVLPPLVVHEGEDYSEEVLRIFKRK